MTGRAENTEWRIAATVLHGQLSQGIDRGRDLCLRAIPDFARTSRCMPGRAQPQPRNRAASRCRFAISQIERKKRRKGNELHAWNVYEEKGTRGYVFDTHDAVVLSVRSSAACNRLGPEGLRSVVVKRNQPGGLEDLPESGGRNRHRHRRSRGHA